MKILQLAKFPPNQRGGIEKLTKQLSEYGYKQERRIDILCFDEREKSRFDVYYRYTVFRARTIFRLFSTPLSIHNLYFLKKLWDTYDVVHIHLPNPSSVVYALLLGGSKTVSLHFHAEARELRLYRIYRHLERMILERATCIITTSPILATCKTLLPYKDKVRVSPLGLSPEDYIVPTDESVDITTKELGKSHYFIFVGRYAKYKNIGMLIDAFKQVKERNESVDLVLIGSGKEYCKILRKIRHSEMDDRVHIFENANDTIKRYLLSKAQALLLPSTTVAEAYGYVQLEAMAMNCPVISFRIPNSGVSWVNEDQVTGTTMDIGSYSENVDKLAKAMWNYLEWKDYRELHARNARKKSMDYSAETLIEQLFNEHSKKILGK